MNEIAFAHRISSFDNVIESKLKSTENNESFSDVFNDAIKTVDQYQKEADSAASELAAGNVKDIHNTMIAMEKSSISLQLLIEIRNNLVETYKELSRMQV